MSEPTNDVRERMQETARMVAATLPPFTGFIIFAFDVETDKGRMEYISNCDRRDCVEALKEWIEKTEQGWMKHLP
jgi:hypothetical protein